MKDICNHADLSRQTFYQIFESKEEILEYEFSILFQQFVEQFQKLQTESIQGLAVTFFDFWEVHQDIIQILTENHIQYLLEEQFERYLFEIDLFNIYSKEDEEPKYSAAFLAGGLSQILFCWLSEEDRTNAERMGDIVENLITGNNIGK